MVDPADSVLYCMSIYHHHSSTMISRGEVYECICSSLSQHVHYTLQNYCTRHKSNFMTVKNGQCKSSKFPCKYGNMFCNNGS